MNTNAANHAEHLGVIFKNVLIRYNKIVKYAVKKMAINKNNTRL